jgi:hypothetical protein
MSIVVNSQTQKPLILCIQEERTSDPRDEPLNPKLAQVFQEYRLIHSSEPGYCEPTTSTSEAFELPVMSISGSTTDYQSTDISETSESTQNTGLKNDLISWREAVKQEAKTYQALQEEITAGREAEGRYWQFLDEED